MGWSRDYPLGSSPHFFKIFFPCNSSRRLEIPRGFCKHIKPKNPGYVALKGPSGNVWNVKLVRAVDGSMSFQNGWEEFVADHNLGIGDFLLFQYDGDLNFVVLVFDRTSCEKEDTFHAFPCHEVKVQVDNQERKCAREAPVNQLDTADPEQVMPQREINLSVACQTLSKKKRCSTESHLERRPQIVDGSLVTNEADLDCRSADLDMLAPQIVPSPPPTNMEPGIIQPPSSLKHALRNQPCLHHSDHLTDAGTKELLGEQAYRPQTGAIMLKQDVNNRTEVAEAPQHDKSPIYFMKHKKLAVKRFLQRRRTISHSSNAVKQYCHERSICLASPSSDNVTIRVNKRVESRRRPVTEDEKAKALKAAMLFQSKDPFCICVMRDSYVYCGFFMYLPNAFTQNLPNCAIVMKLRDPDNEVWMTTYKRYGKTGALSAGWGKFARAHNLEMDDVCVFELTKPDEMQVHIFRVVEEITPYNLSSRRRKN